MGNDGMQAIRARFEQRCKDWVIEINSLMDGPNTDPIPRLAELIHKMAGIAGSLGYDDISAHAIKLNTAIAEGQAVDRGDLVKLCDGLRAVGEAR